MNALRTIVAVPLLLIAFVLVGGLWLVLSPLPPSANPLRGWISRMVGG